MPLEVDKNIMYYIMKYWWIIMLGALLLLIVISAFILTFRKSRKNDKGSSNSDTSPLLHTETGYGSVSVSIREDIAYDEIKLGDRIGKGNFGEVFVGYWRGTKVAIKQCKIPTVSSEAEKAEFLRDFEKEAAIMRTLRHPNILQFLGITNTGSQICIITEYMPKGSLYRILHNKAIYPDSMLNWNLKTKIAIDIAKGMNYLHGCKPIIIHRDLKSHNLLVDENFKVKVADFGLAKLLNSHESQTEMTACGTPAYTAPEVLRNEVYTEKADIFSYALVLWELVTREEPHRGVPPFQIVFAVGNQALRPPIPSSCPHHYTILIEECWIEQPNQRPSFEEILNRLESSSL